MKKWDELLTDIQNTIFMSRTKTKPDKPRYSLYIYVLDSSAAYLEQYRSFLALLSEVENCDYENIDGKLNDSFEYKLLKHQLLEKGSINKELVKRITDEIESASYESISGPIVNNSAFLGLKAIVEKLPQL